MRVLVATNQLQESATGDHADTVEGELVLVEVAECGDLEHCGCGRDWLGMASRRTTTTAMVVDLAHLTERDVRGAVMDWLETSGCADLVRDAAGRDGEFLDEDTDVEEVLGAIVDEHLELIADVCDAFPVGSVLERSGKIVRERRWPAAA